MAFSPALLVYFDPIILKLADKLDMDDHLDEFENLLDHIIYFRVTSPSLLKTSTFDLAIRISPLVLLGPKGTLIR